MDDKFVEHETEQIMVKIDSQSDPTQMSQQQALDYYESIIDELRGRLDGLKSDMGIE